MTEQDKKKIDKKVLILSFGIIALLLVFLVMVGMAGKEDTLLFPGGMALFLILYWVVVDVLPIIWKREFANKTEEQKRAYYVYAAIDAAGLSGLVYFVADMGSMTGAFIYVASILLKRRFQEQYRGTDGADETEGDVKAVEDGSENRDAAGDGTAGIETAANKAAGITEPIIAETAGAGEAIVKEADTAETVE